MSGKVKYHELSDFEKRKYLGEFYSMVALLKNREEVKNFFKDLLTLSEVVMISRRIQAAKMLLEGYKYEEIRAKLRIGFSTINQVERWLNNGFGGYRKTIMEYKKKTKKITKSSKLGEVPYSAKWIKKKYPLHFLLANLLETKEE